MIDPKELRPSDIPDDYRGAYASVAYTLRALRRAIYVGDDVSDHRKKSIPEELTSAIEGEHAPGDTCSTWLSRLAARWSISLAAIPVGESLRPLRVYLTDGFFASWDVVSSRVPSCHLDRIVDDADKLATFACRFGPMEGAEDYDVAAEIDAAILDVAEPARPAAPWVPSASAFGVIVEPGRWRSLWSAEGPFAHGADERNGNVVGIRRMPLTDTLTGVHAEVPFLSGNAARGVCRRMLLGDQIERAGLTVPDVSVGRAHTLLDGGTLEGSSPKINAEVRRRLRALMPALDLFGGNWDRTETMAGWLLCESALLVCRETAGLFARHLAPGVDPREWRESLHPAASLVSQQQLTSRPSELEEPASPVLARVEVVSAGSLFVHRVAVHGRVGYGEAPPLVLSALAYMLRLLRGRGAAGAANSRGMGRLLMGEYIAEGSVAALPSPDLYLEHVERHAAEVREVLTSGPVTPTPAEKPTKTEKPKRGKKGDATPPATAAAPPVEADAQPSLL